MLPRIARWESYCDNCGLDWCELSPWTHRPRWLNCFHCKEDMVFSRLIGKIE